MVHFSIVYERKGGKGGGGRKTVYGNPEETIKHEWRKYQKIGSNLLKLSFNSPCAFADFIFQNYNTYSMRMVQPTTNYLRTPNRTPIATAPTPFPFD